MKSSDKKVLIIGAGTAGQDILNEILRSPELGLKVVAFLDDDLAKQGLLIKKTPVLGLTSTLEEVVKKQLIDEVIIAIPSADGQKISEVVKFCLTAKVKFKIVPRVKEIIEGKAQIQNVRKVQVEDLLGRPVVQSDIKGLRNFFDKKQVLVSGAAGSIGSELTRQIAAYSPAKLILIDWWENGMFDLIQELSRLYPNLPIEYYIANCQDSAKIDKIFSKLKIDYVFHAAAYKHVPLMEDNPDEAVKNIIFGTLNMAEIACKYQIEKFVYVSTDKAANPKNIMGACKLIGEGIVKKLNGDTKFITVRFGNVLDSFGSVIPLFRKQIEQGGPVTVTDKRMTRYFMTIPEAAQLILKAAAQGEGGELFILDMGKPVKILDLAISMIRLSGFEPDKDIEIKFTGIRKGEKLEEKLFTRREGLHKTQQENIYKTESLGLDSDQVFEEVAILKKLIEQEDVEGIRTEFNKLIRNFS